MAAEKVIETDVLVIGGGMAGCFAAVKAKEQGVDVILVEKGYVSRSGSTPFCRGFNVCHPDWGHNLDASVERLTTTGEYVNNRDWTRIIFEESYARYQDLVAWGVEFSKDENGKLITNHGDPKISETLQLPYGKFAHILRKQPEKSGVKIMDKIMITDLLKNDEKIVGAIGIAVESADLYVFKAKATIMCTGTTSFKPLAFPISMLTGDGEAVAYRAGVEITGKEFNDCHPHGAENPAAFAAGYASMHRPGGTSGGMAAAVNAEGDELPGRPGVLFLNMEFEAHAGRAPIYRGTSDGKRSISIGGAATGASVHMGEGIWPLNMECASSLAGLYAAGDCCGIMQVGSVYAGGGLALPAAATSGTKAAVAAAKYAEKVEKPVVAEEEIARLKGMATAPLERKGGFSPAWVTQVLQNTVRPYFILFVKKEDRMQAALTMVEFMRDHLSPKMFARDPHELRLAHEAKNMVLNAEMKLRASLFRTESRGTHYREDYPRRDDPEWLAWVLLKEENGRMKAYKKPVPREWWPDLSIPYEERYPARFPGE